MNALLVLRALRRDGLRPYADITGEKPLIRIPKGDTVTDRQKRRINVYREGLLIHLIYENEIRYANTSKSVKVFCQTCDGYDYTHPIPPRDAELFDIPVNLWLKCLTCHPDAERTFYCQRYIVDYWMRKRYHHKIQPCTKCGSDNFANLFAISDKPVICRQCYVAHEYLNMEPTIKPDYTEDELAFIQIVKQIFDAKQLA